MPARSIALLRVAQRRSAQMSMRVYQASVSARGVIRPDAANDASSHT